MTKYILCGGFDKTDTLEDRLAKTKNFYNEVISETPETIKILLCTFAKEDKDGVQSVDRIKKILSTISHKNIEYVISDDINFQKQVTEADIVFFLGGRTEKLLSSLVRYENLKTLLKDKIVAGESAGANILCTKSYSPRAEKVINCLSFLPIKVIPHYKEEYKNILLEEDNLERLILREYEYKVYLV
jgi:peptidase E